MEQSKERLARQRFGELLPNMADYVRAHAQELADGVTAAHIDLYVNEFSAGYGHEGEAAIAALVDRAVAAGAAPSCDLPLFVG